MFNIEEKIKNYLKGKKVKNQPVATLTSSEEVEEKQPKTNVENENRDKFHKLLEESKLKLSELEGENGRVILEKITVNPKTEEEIIAQATEEVDNEYLLKRNDIDKNAQNKRVELQRKTQDVEASAEGKKQEVENSYAGLEKGLENQAIKRGIARSSIIAEQLRSLGVDKIRDLLNVDNEIASQIRKYGDEIAELERNYTFEIQALDVEKALDTKKRIEELTEKQNKEIENAVKHNNQVDKNQLYIDDKYYGGVDSTKASEVEMEKSRIRQQMITDAMSYYASLPKEQRIKEFENDEELKELLGDLYYNLERYVKYFP